MRRVEESAAPVRGRRRRLAMALLSIPLGLAVCWWAVLQGMRRGDE